MKTMDRNELRKKEEEYINVKESVLKKAQADAFEGAKRKTLEPVLGEIAFEICLELGGGKKLSREKRKALKASEEYKERIRECTEKNELIRAVHEANSLEEIPVEVKERFEKHFKALANRLRLQYVNEAGEDLCKAMMEIILELSEKNSRYQIQEKLITQYWGIISYTFQKKRVNISARRFGKEMLSVKNYNSFMEMLTDRQSRRAAENRRKFILGFAGSQSRLEKEIQESIFSLEDERMQEINRIQGERREINVLLNTLLTNSRTFEKIGNEILRALEERLSPSAVRTMLKENPFYHDLLEAVILAQENEERIKQGILTTVPQRLIDMYPLARKMKRQFVIHVGPTNSGKSHDALEALKKAENGIYLAPLRLLAYEKYEELNEAGVPCDMKTGEEELSMPGARVRSCTIEILDIREAYDIAVIDEGQLLGNPERGSAWTEAILGLQAEEIHICTAPEGLQVIKNVLKECGDSYRIVEHKRFTNLKLEKKSFSFPRDCKSGDCCIAFSRKSVHLCAEKLRKKGIGCSIIYGALPYDVRRNEAKRFLRGETQVIAATDAVGMGLNLPIRRVIFLEDTKFDGRQRRELYGGEIRQIAGRAGRYGVFEEGFVNVDRELNKELVRKALEQVPASVEKCYIGFPDSLLGIEGPVSNTMEQWQKMETSSNYHKASLDREIKLCRRLEQLSDDKELIYRFVKIPFDEENRELYKMWRHMFICIKENYPYDYSVLDMELPDKLSELEQYFKQLDLLYYFTDNFVKNDIIRVVLERKKEVSGKISRLLEKQAFDAGK